MAKKTVHNPYCFSERLQEQLARIPGEFLTVVEAPSGFGKTTAIREYFTATRRSGACEKWYTCLGESPAKAWAGICGLFCAADDTLAQKLMEFGVPARETLPDIIALLHDCRTTRTSYIIIDNYQLFNIPVQKKLITALSACQIKKLHLVIITQPLKDDNETTHQENPHHKITTRDFFFNNACIAKYCRLTGISISSAVIQQIQTVSEGWVAAIRLQLKQYEESGVFKSADGLRPLRTWGAAGAINSLMETAVWNRLSASERDFMLAVSLLDGFTAQQAAIMGDGAAMPQTITELLSLDFFIRRVADKNVYSIHSILREYLLERFAMQSKTSIDAMHRKAASACLAVGDYFQAAQFFMKAPDYDAILSLPFTDQYFFNNQERDIIQFFERLFQKCPSSTLLKHPLTMVAVGIQFFKKGMREQYANIVKLMENFLKSPSGLSETELYRVKGEFEMMLFFSRFNDVAKMGEHHRKAYEYLKHVSTPPRSRIYAGNLPWAVGVPSVISVYWSVSGGLQQALTAMDECLPFYTALAGGHGAGGEILMRAEVCLAAGNDRDAETLCYKALYAASGAGQTGNCLCAELLLARIGILRGDEKAYSAARRNIERDMAQARQTALTRLGEMGLAHLDMAFGKTDKLPEWLRHTEAVRRTLYGVTQPHAMMLHSMMLLREKRRAELYALTEPAMHTAAAMHYPLLRTHHLIFLTLAKQDDGRVEEAATHLLEALAIALPDRVYLPFAEHGDALLPMLERLQENKRAAAGGQGAPMEFKDAGGLRPSRTWGAAGGQGPPMDFLEECIALCRRWTAGMADLRRSLSQESSVLTPRQREIALLIREGFSAKEIAAKLFLSANTITSVRKEIYSKLNINSNMKLAKAKL